MIISEQNKYIFISVPKTGTRSIQKLLLEKDPSARKNRIIINNKELRVPEHITARELKNVMGNDYNNYKKIGFVRNPYSKIVSSYFFYRGGELTERKSRKAKKILSKSFKLFSAKILPFSFWSVIYPFKSNIGHLTDKNHQLLVDFVGRYESLHEDLIKIFNQLNVDFTIDTIPHINKSNHKDFKLYYKNAFHKFLIENKVKKDLIFYEEMLKF